MSKELYRKSVGRRIKKIRLGRQLNMQAFANLIHQHNESSSPGKSNVSRWERGENIPNDLTLKAIANIGNTTIDYLLNENPLAEYNTEELWAELKRKEMEFQNKLWTTDLWKIEEERREFIIDRTIQSKKSPHGNAD